MSGAPSLFYKSSCQAAVISDNEWSLQNHEKASRQLRDFWEEEGLCPPRNCEIAVRQHRDFWEEERLCPTRNHEIAERQLSDFWE